MLLCTCLMLAIESILNVESRNLQKLLAMLLSLTQEQHKVGIPRKGAKYKTLILLLIYFTIVNSSLELLLA